MPGKTYSAHRNFRLFAVFACGGFLLWVTLAVLRGFAVQVHAAPIEPPEGYPKLRFSTKTVDPILAATGGATLEYTIEIRNTGAYTAFDATLTDVIPAGTSYNGDAQSSVPPQPVFSDGTLSWQGDVGFDSTVVIQFSVMVDPAFSGVVRNSAVISHALIAQPVTVTAETRVTDDPLLTIDKTASPQKPGADKPLFYTLQVTNLGQAATNLPITVTDQVPADTELLDVGPDGTASPDGSLVTWNRAVDLIFGQTTVFTFSVNLSDVPSGTVITNDAYDVEGPAGVLTSGLPYTTTVVDPILALSKHVWPDPPGSNREMTYTLELLNKGSLATGLVITDRVPSGVTYVSGGMLAGGVVSWALSELDTGEVAEFTFTVSVGDVMDVTILNDAYGACSAEGVCVNGDPLASLVHGPTFAASAILDPIAKHPGGGTGPVTPTLVVRNLGPGSAIDATALLIFERISVQASDLIVIPPVGTSPPLPSGPACGENCVSYIWTGPIGAGDVITFTTIDGQNTIGGDEGTVYTATVELSDEVGSVATEPITATAVGKVTHFASLEPTKGAPPVIGRGQTMTYTISVWNSGLSTDEPPYPWLTDTVPANVTVVQVNDGGELQTVNGQEIVQWTLPHMSPGDTVNRSYEVRVDDDLISGTLLVNDDYRVNWYEVEADEVFSNTGKPVTTTVREVGLIDSFKAVTPTLASPGPGNVLTYSLHIVNTSPNSLNGVTVYDTLPWESSTYQRDAVATAGQVISDIVSISWTGNVPAFSSQVLTFTVVVDPDYKGPVANTAVIEHSSLLEPVVVQAVAYITDEPVLRITKEDSPDPIKPGDELLYSIQVENLGQLATDLVVVDTVPANTVYVPGSASGGGQLVGGQVRWEFSALNSGKKRLFSFLVTVGNTNAVINNNYRVDSAEGAAAVGDPVVTTVQGTGNIFLPILLLK